MTNKTFRIIDISVATHETCNAITTWAHKNKINIRKQGGLTIEQIIDFDNRPVKRKRRKLEPDMKEVKSIMKALAVANGDLKEND